MFRGTYRLRKLFFELYRTSKYFPVVQKVESSLNLFSENLFSEIPIPIGFHENVIKIWSTHDMGGIPKFIAATINLKTFEEGATNYPCVYTYCSITRRIRQLLGVSLSKDNWKLLFLWCLDFDSTLIPSEISYSSTMTACKFIADWDKCWFSTKRINNTLLQPWTTNWFSARFCLWSCSFRRGAHQSGTLE